MNVDPHRPSYPELAAIILVGALHVVTEVFLSRTVALWYNVAACVAFAIYLAWRAAGGRRVLRAWGMRLDNFAEALWRQALFGAVAVLFLLGLGLATRGSVSLPGTFWLTLWLYPAWGIAQQFALQNLTARNLKEVVRHPVALALVSAALFGASHLPRLPLVALTSLAGVFFTWIYQRHPNLWAVGIVHGVLGSLAFYVVLGEDPGAKILEFLAQ